MTDQPDTPTDEFGDHMPYYQRGQAWYDALVGSALAHAQCIEELADYWAREAERLVDPLGGVDDPDLLREFIAGAHRQADGFRSEPHEDRDPEEDTFRDGHAGEHLDRRAHTRHAETVTFVDFAARTLGRELDLD